MTVTIAGLIGSACQLVPVLSVEDVDVAEPLLDALEAGGVGVAKVTLRTRSALAVFERMGRHGGNITVAAGTLTLPEHFQQVRDAGARFAVSRAFTDRLAEAAT